MKSVEVNSTAAEYIESVKAGMTDSELRTVCNGLTAIVETLHRMRQEGEHSPADGLLDAAHVIAEHYWLLRELEKGDSKQPHLNIEEL